MYYCVSIEERIATSHPLLRIRDIQANERRKPTEHYCKAQSEREWIPKDDQQRLINENKTRY